MNLQSLLSLNSGSSSKHEADQVLNPYTTICTYLGFSCE